MPEIPLSGPFPAPKGLSFGRTLPSRHEKAGGRAVSATIRRGKSCFRPGEAATSLRACLLNQNGLFFSLKDEKSSLPGLHKAEEAGRSGRRRPKQP